MPPATAAPATTSADPAASALASTSTPAAATAMPTYNYSDNVSSDQALQDLTNFETSSKSPIDIYNEAVNKLGIADVRTGVTKLRKNIADTNALLSALPDSVSGRTSGSLVTEAQRQRVLATERAPLDQANASYGNQYSMESQNLNDLTNQANVQSGLVSEGQNNIRTALQGRLSNIQSKEAETRRREEADRAFQASLDSVRVQQEQFAKTMAENQRQFNVTSSRASAAVAPQQANQSMLAELASYAQKYKSTLGSNPNGTRENIIQALTTKYGAYVDPKAISALVYQTYIPDSLEKQNRTKAGGTPQKALMSSLGYSGAF